MNKHICIHGHFYQPPRENPWLEAIELQDSAHPYHDWNQRITAECYAPNAFARMLDGEGRITEIVNNYSRISFNFGPTLLAWLQQHAPLVHEAVVQADVLSRERFSGHGSALAQAYNHVILPLANPRDQQTQVLWGIRDFVSRFNRQPEGMWLAETAADTASLEVLAEHGIRFTILSPFQASQVRPADGSGDWVDVNGGQVDPKIPYLVRLPSGREISLFFYDAAGSRAVAFEQLLNRGETFAGRLLGAFVDGREEDQLVHIATDGESYGHHHRRGEMALAYALHQLEQNPDVHLTNYGEYLETHPPTMEARIHEMSAWSCAHGVERWRSDCGCNSGGHPGWNQGWRAPLREALDWLRDRLATEYESRATQFLREPWTARNEYISVLLDRSETNLQRFLADHCHRPPEGQERVDCLRLLEMQRHAMLMYTSCGWFFDELSGIETVQVIQYAGRALQLAKDLLGLDLEAGFLDILSRARSNIADHRDGKRIYEKFVRPAVVDREKVCAHYAVSSLFTDYDDPARVYSFTCEQEDRQVFEAGKARLAFGRSRVAFQVTGNADTLTYGVLHFGDHNINCGVRLYQGPEAYQQALTELRQAFERADFPQVIRLMDQHFQGTSYSLKSLFRDEQRNVLRQILESTQKDIEQRFRQITDSYTPLMRFLDDLGAPLPSALQAASEFVLNYDLLQELESPEVKPRRVRQLIKEGRRRSIEFHTQSLEYAFQQNLERLMGELAADPFNLERLGHVTSVAALIPRLPFEGNLWRSQNACYQMLQSVWPQYAEQAEQGEESALKSVKLFSALGRHLGFRSRRRSGDRNR